MKLRQATWVVTPPLLIIIALSLLWNYWAHEKVVRYAISQIPTLNDRQNSAFIKVGNLDISLLKLQVRANDVHITFKNEFDYLSEASIDNIKIQVDPFNLMIGQIYASYVRIESLNWDLGEKAFKKIFQSNSGPTPQIDLEPVFKWLPDIPIQNIYLANSKLKLALPRSETHSLVELRLNISSFQVGNQKKTVEIVGTQINLNLRSEKNVSIDVDADMYLKFDVKSIKKITLKVIKNNSLIEVSGSSGRLHRYQFLRRRLH